MSGHTVKKFDPTPARCYPSKPTADCSRCGRFTRGEPSDERVVSIDGTAIRQKSCAMWTRRVVELEPA